MLAEPRKMKLILLKKIQLLICYELRELFLFHNHTFERINNLRKFDFNHNQKNSILEIISLKNMEYRTKTLVSPIAKSLGSVPGVLKICVQV